MNDFIPTRSAAPRLRSSEVRPRKRDEWLARGLGYMSLGLAAWHLLTPGRVAKTLGLDSTPRVRAAMVAFGLRELLNGTGILRSRRRTPWLWMRVGGDLMDLGVLGTMMTGKRRIPRHVIGPAAGVLAGALLVDTLAASRSTSTVLEETAVVTINRPPEEVYAFWRRFENLPTFMENIESVQVMDEDRSHWVVTGPAGITFEWDAELVQDHENKVIAWRSVEKADIRNTGAVRFRPAPGDRGTEVRVDLRWEAPAGRFGAALARLFGREPGQQAMADLRRLKQVLETGGVVHSDASLHRRPHAARPSGDLKKTRKKENERAGHRRARTEEPKRTRGPSSGDAQRPAPPNGPPIATQDPTGWESVS